MSQISDIGEQHPLEKYIAKARFLASGRGCKDPVAVVDRRRLSACVPRLYGVKPDAHWQSAEEKSDDCPCPICDDGAYVEREVSPFDAEQAPVTPHKPVGLADFPDDWVGHALIGSGDKAVDVYGLIFGDEYGSAENIYVVVGATQAAVDWFFHDVRAKKTALMRKASPSCIFVSNSDAISRPCVEWEDVVLKPEHRSTIESNISAFFKAKSAFKKHRLAYRRGLLLVGPPGNGKSSVIKVLASKHRDMAFFMYGFQASGGDDSARLKRLFDRAAEFSPAIVVLEDIDRVANDSTMRAILNILDGITSSDGVFVLATSNNAGQIDPALIERPSRFDLVLRFDNPEPVQRLEYLRKRLGPVGCTEEQLSNMCAQTGGYSMAMLQELLAGALLEAVLAGVEPSWEHVQTSFKRLQDSRAIARKETGREGGNKTGFVRAL